MEIKILKYFKYEHLPEHLQAVSKPFSDLAHKVAQDAPDTDMGEKITALRKLLEAKDAAVRCYIK